MPEYTWPKPSESKLLGKYHDRLDGPVKSAGAAKYSYDVVRPGMLYAVIVRCPYGAAEVKSIDTASVEKMPGVKKVLVLPQKEKAPPLDATLTFAGHEVAIVVADTEERVQDAAAHLKVQYDVRPFLAEDADVDAIAKKAPGRVIAKGEKKVGDPEAALAAVQAKSEGRYGAPVLTHCCLEPHGSVAEWNDADKSLTVWLSTQAVAKTAGDYSNKLKLPRANVKVFCEYMGGGFGSKFNPELEGEYAALLSQELKAPVKLLLDREGELKAGGVRPSHYAHITVGGTKDGEVTVWQSRCWGTQNEPPLPYVFVGVPNQKTSFSQVAVNTGPHRAWRAPNHPQAAVLAMGALADFAAACGLDELEFFKKNAGLAVRPGEPGKPDTAKPIFPIAPEVYREELDVAAFLIGWKKKWHPRGDKTPGPIKRGLGISLHTWGGGPVLCNCELTIHPDGAVEAKSAHQDLGTGTRTVIALVAAETLGLGVDKIKVRIGDSRFVPGNPSGGSITVGSISSATRRAAVDALELVFSKLGDLGEPADLKAEGGKIVNAKTGKSIAWKDACAKLGMMPATAVGKSDGNPNMPKQLTSLGVGGVQIAEVAVDVETGVVRIENFVAVQDCGRILNMKAAESQVYGGVIQGLCGALFEERVLDPVTGDFLNADMEFYKLAGIGDVGRIKVHMMTGPKYDERGVIGLGEPPVISPAAATANAVANAIGARVGTVPLTPDKVLAALGKGGAK